MEVENIVSNYFLFIWFLNFTSGIDLNHSKFVQNVGTKYESTRQTQDMKDEKVEMTSIPVVISSLPTKLINKTWNCSDISRKILKVQRPGNSVYVYYSDYDPYVCHLNPLHCERPKEHEKFNKNKNVLTELPKYGDYSYLPISKWLQLLQHGAVVFLYHPCIDKHSIEKLRTVAKKCIWKHVITPYEKLNLTHPIAMVAWGSFYADSQVNITASEAWIKKYAMKAPASHFILNGRYNINLLQPATMVSDSVDSNLCPKKQVKKTMDEDMDILNEHYNTIYNQGKSSKTLKKQLLQKIKHGLRPEKRTVNTNNAAWAVASLLFLCLILLFVLVYTKPWNERDYYLKEKMSSKNNNSGFSLIKNHGHPSWRQLAEKHRNIAVSRRLLGPIHEEDEDFMDL